MSLVFRNCYQQLKELKRLRSDHSTLTVLVHCMNRIQHPWNVNQMWVDFACPFLLPESEARRLRQIQDYHLTVLIQSSKLVSWNFSLGKLKEDNSFWVFGWPPKISAGSTVHYDLFFFSTRVFSPLRHCFNTKTNFSLSTCAFLSFLSARHDPDLDSNKGWGGN